jgi:hypothetical protein
MTMAFAKRDVNGVGCQEFEFVLPDKHTRPADVDRLDWQHYRRACNPFIEISQRGVGVFGGSITLPDMSRQGRAYFCNPKVAYMDFVCAGNKLSNAD